MLPPVTKAYGDRSTDTYYRFDFYCDACGAVWSSERYPFSLSDSPPRGTAERRAHDILWRAEHDAAYERANIEALFHFNKCPKCGRRVCDECFSEFGETCLACEKNSL